MKKLRQHLKLGMIVIPIVLIKAPAAFAQAEAYSGIINSQELFQENCAVCHGENLEGAAQGTPLRLCLLEGHALAGCVGSCQARCQPRAGHAATSWPRGGIG